MSAVDLKNKTKTELLKIALRLGLRGVSTMTKPKLVEAIRRAKQRRAVPIRKQTTSATQKIASATKRRAMRKPAKASAHAKMKTAGKRRKIISKKVNAVVVAAGQAAHKFDVAPAKQPIKQVFKEECLGELPDTYGTGRLFLAARDPNYLFAYWDWSHQQMADFRRQAVDGRVVLRVFEKNHPSPIAEVTLAHDARNWYIPVNKPATTYTVELGFWQRDGMFNIIKRSRETTTPPAALAADVTPRFATIPVDVKFEELLGIGRQHLKHGEHLAEVIHRLQSAGFQFPFPVDVKPSSWSPAQAAQVEQTLSGDVLQHAQVGSVELTEWLRRRLQDETSSGMFSGFSPSGASWSGQPQQGFWFEVNAELTIYGATEPDAIVTVDGKPVTLRSDGTFSFRHTFPDGKYRLPVVAVSGKNGEQRTIELQFERQTQAHRTPPVPK